MDIDVKYVAKLARLELSGAQSKKLQAQLQDILGYVEKLKSVDTEKVTPLSHAVSLQNIFREDEKKESLPNEDALKNAPQKKEKFFKVPKVI